MGTAVDVLAAQQLTAHVIDDPAELLARRAEWDALVVAQARPRYNQPADAIAAMATESVHRSLAVVCLVDERGALVAGAAFVREPWNLDWRIRTHRRRHRVLRVPMTSAQFVGGGFVGRDDPAVQLQLLAAVDQHLGDVDVLRFVHVDTSSTLWGLLGPGGVSVGSRWAWRPVDPIAGLGIRLAPDAAAYWKSQVSAKTRHNYRREWRLLEEASDGDLRVDVYTEPERVPELLAACESVHQRSWHAAAGAALLRNTEERASQQAHIAREGRLRSYVLRGKGEPIAFAQAYRIAGTCVLIRMAYDQAWAARSPGKALVRQIIDDLHAAPDIDYLDFGHGIWPYKEILANERHASSDVLLVRRNLRNALAFSGPVSWSAIKRNGLGALDRSGHLQRVQGWSRKRLAR